MHPCHSKFLVTKFILGFIEFEKISTFGQTFGLPLYRPSAVGVEAEGEKPSPSVDRWLGVKWNHYLVVQDVLTLSQKNNLITLMPGINIW